MGKVYNFDGYGKCKLHFDYNGINNEVIPSINDTLVKIDNALVICNNIVAPPDPALASILSSAKAELEKDRQDLKAVKEWLEKSSRIYKSRIESIESALNKLSVDKVKLKEDWIKEITYEE